MDCGFRRADGAAQNCRVAASFAGPKWPQAGPLPAAGMNFNESPFMQ